MNMFACICALNSCFSLSCMHFMLKHLLHPDYFSLFSRFLSLLKFFLFFCISLLLFHVSFEFSLLQILFTRQILSSISPKKIVFLLHFVWHRPQMNDNITWICIARVCISVVVSSPMPFFFISISLCNPAQLISAFHTQNNYFSRYPTQYSSTTLLLFFTNCFRTSSPRLPPPPPKLISSHKPYNFILKLWLQYLCTKQQYIELFVCEECEHLSWHLKPSH